LSHVKPGHQAFGGEYGGKEYGLQTQPYSCFITPVAGIFPGVHYSRQVWKRSPLGQDVPKACLLKVGREDRAGEEGMLCQRICQRILSRA